MSIQIPIIISTDCFYSRRGYLQEIYLKKSLRKNKSL